MFTKPKEEEKPVNDCIESSGHAPGKWSLFGEYDPPIQVRTCPTCNKIVDWDELWENL